MNIKILIYTAVTASLAVVGGAIFFFSQEQNGHMLCYKDLVCDSQEILGKDKLIEVERYHTALLNQYDIDLRVMTGSLSTAQIIKLFKDAEIGERSKTRKGVLLVIDEKLNSVRFEISAGLDAVYTDSFVSFIQRNQMIPFFKANQVGNGILATTELIVNRAQQAEKGAEFIPLSQLPQNLAIGAGAQASANIGTGYETPEEKGNKISAIKNGLSPLDIVALYHQSLGEGNSAYNLPIFSQASQQVRKNWVITPAQMQNELNTFKNCNVFKEVILEEKGLAAVLYNVDQRQCSPYLFVLEEGEWRIDLITMMNSIRFNVSNEWHLDLKKSIPHADVFDDWNFNHNGYPFPMKKMRWGMTVETDRREDITIIKKIYPNSPVSSLPLKENDIILDWNGIQKPSYKDVISSMDKLESNEKVKINLLRDGQKLNIEILAPPRIN